MTNTVYYTEWVNLKTMVWCLFAGCVCVCVCVCDQKQNTQNKKPGTTEDVLAIENEISTRIQKDNGCSSHFRITVQGDKIRVKLVTYNPKHRFNPYSQFFSFFQFYFIFIFSFYLQIASIPIQFYVSNTVAKLRY